MPAVESSASLAYPSREVRLPTGWAVLFLVVVLLAGCAPGANELVRPAEVAGFWLGLWHGLIAPVTFVISLFTPAVNLYEVRNSGGWYDFGFILGLSMTFSSGGAGAGRAGRPRRRR